MFCYGMEICNNLGGGGGMLSLSGSLWFVSSWAVWVNPLWMQYTEIKFYHFDIFTLSPPGWRGIVVTVRAGGRAAGRAAAKLAEPISL